MSRHVALLCVAVIAQPAQPQETVGAPTLPPVGIERFLPVHTEVMRPGPLEAQKRRTGVSRPFFLIGCDDYSLGWIAKNREQLRELRAFGLVVEAADAEAYGRLEAAAEGLLVRPVAGDLIAEHLGVQRYPALITSDGIFP